MLLGTVICQNEKITHQVFEDYTHRHNPSNQQIISCVFSDSE